MPNITFHFLNGPWDGETLVAVVKRSGEPIEEAEALWRMTAKGKIGARFVVKSPLAVAMDNSQARSSSPQSPFTPSHPHVYEVSSRMRKSECVVLQCRYVGVELSNS
jgi:hypothetical protein